MERELKDGIPVAIVAQNALRGLPQADGPRPGLPRVRGVLHLSRGSCLACVLALSNRSGATVSKNPASSCAKGTGQPGGKGSDTGGRGVSERL